MALPEQVQKQLEEAEQLAAGLAPPAEDPAPPVAPDPEPPPAQEPPPPPAPPPAEDPSWQQRYQTLQGIHRADVDRLNGQVATLQSTITELTAKVEAATKPPAPEPAPAAKLVTDSDLEAFGPDLVDLIRRATAEAVAPVQEKLDAAQAELARTKGTVEDVATTQTKSNKTALLDELTKAVPDWQDVNVNPAFLQWLGQNDPLSGLQRQTLLDSALAQFDAARVATLFNTWKSTQTPAPPAPAPAPTPDTLAAQVQPGSSRGQIPPQPAAVKQWSPQAIEAHYHALARGDFKGREAEAAKIEAEIDSWMVANATGSTPA